MRRCAPRRGAQRQAGFAGSPARNRTRAERWRGNKIVVASTRDSACSAPTAAQLIALARCRATTQQPTRRLGMRAFSDPPLLLGHGQRHVISSIQSRRSLRICARSSAHVEVERPAVVFVRAVRRCPVSRREAQHRHARVRRTRPGADSFGGLPVLSSSSRSMLLSRCLQNSHDGCELGWFELSTKNHSSVQLHNKQLNTT